MGIPTQVTFRGLAHSETIETEVLEHVAWLERFYSDVVSCRVLVELPNRHRRDGRQFHVRLELAVPNGEPVIVNHEPSTHGPLKDVAAAAHQKDNEITTDHRYARVAVRDAFDVARRRLQDFSRRQRGAVKTHEMPAHGVISEIRPSEQFGYIDADGRQIYFSRSSVLDNAFEELATGTPVAFVEEKGEKGPQASTVRVLGKHHYGPSESPS
jgi:cold shock CspA family protein